MESSMKHYTCDPLKNTDCKKTFCKYNADALIRVCDRTSNPAFAMLDKLNRPMEAPEKSAEQFAREVRNLFRANSDEKGGDDHDVRTRAE